jgi:hypothetical protein
MVESKSHVLVALSPLRQQCFPLVVRCKGVHDFLSTRRALVADDPLPLPHIKPSRFHHAFAERCSIPRAYIVHVLTPQALRAVIAVRAATEWLDSGIAVTAREWFFTGEEGHTLNRKSTRLNSSH